MKATLQQLQAEARELKEKITRNREVSSDTTLRNEATGVKDIDSLALKCQRTLRGHTNKITSLFWSSSENSRRIVTSSHDGSIILWNTETTNKLHHLPLYGGWILTCTESPNGRLIAAGGLNNVVTVFDLSSYEERAPQRFAKHTGYISAVRFLDDRRVISASGDGTLVMWDVAAGRSVSRFRGHMGDVLCLAVSPDGSTFVSGSCDRTCAIWDFRTGRSVVRFEGHTDDVSAVDFFPTGLCFGAGSDDGTCSLFDLRADRKLQAYAPEAPVNPVTSISFSHSGRLLFTGFENAHVTAWDVLKGTSVWDVQAHDDCLTSLMTSSDGVALATAGWDGLAKIWTL